MFHAFRYMRAHGSIMERQTMTEELRDLGGPPDSIGGDLMFGAPEIARFLFGSRSKAALRRVYNLADGGSIPTFYIGTTVCGRKRTISATIAAAEAKGRVKAA